MKSYSHMGYWVCLVLLGISLFGNPGTARAESIIFTIDPSQSTFGIAPINGGDFVAQSPGSLTAPVSGHFLVDFDPLNATPTSMQFIGGSGYYQVASPYMASPGINGVGPQAPANVAAWGPSAQQNAAIRNLSWDFSSAPLSASLGSFPANQTSFTVLSGGIDLSSPSGSGHSNYVGNQAFMTGGSWTLIQMVGDGGPGNWYLQGSNHYDKDTTSYIATVVATAHFSAANIAPPVTSMNLSTQALGGSTTTGGVSATFSPSTTGGTLTVQQVPNNTALSQAAITAGQENPVFALSTYSVSTNPQIWNAEFTGSLNGGSATLVFNYDPSLLPAGLDPMTLGIWHFSSLTNTWNFGGAVDPLAHTITYVTDSFSPFELGVTPSLSTPEPSTLVLAGSGLVGLLAAARRRRRRC